MEKNSEKALFLLDRIRESPYFIFERTDIVAGPESPKRFSSNGEITLLGSKLTAKDINLGKRLKYVFCFLYII